MVVLFYTRSIPTNLLWWGLQLSSAALMTFAGMWACQRRELQPIMFGGLIGGGANASAANDPASSSGDGLPSSHTDGPGDDPESGLAGFSRGRGRGRIRDGGGDYEMVSMKDAEGPPA